MRGYSAPVKSLRFLLLLLLGWLAFGPAAARSPGDGHMRVTLVAENSAVAPGGEVSLALEMRPEQGWHGYWRNPGDAGAAPRVQWQLPAGWTVGELRFPVPDTFDVLGLMNYVYERDHALLVTLRAPAGVAPGTLVPVRARLDYLVCTDQLCVPEAATVAIELTVGIGGEARDFSVYRSALPRPLTAPARFETAGDQLRIAIPLPPAMAVEEPYFYPITLEAIDHSAPQSISRSGDFLVVETRAGSKAAGLGSIEGVLEIAPGLGLALAAGPGPVPKAGTPIVVPKGEGAPGSASTMLFALLGAIAGGLLLNIMPCVFPILSLKALSLARAGETDRGARREALAYTAGVVLVCLLLGGALLLLRAAGESAGWAFQLQDPRVILLLLLLVTAIALNLSGLFALPAFDGGGETAAAGGVRGAFFTGALAAFVATPCTGPFLGFALGAALVLPTLAALAVFAGLGLGLALPFLLLGFVPALRRGLPRPGPWMERFQRILAVPMFVTALGLVWILGRQSGVDGMALGLASALLLGLALWWLGRRQGRAAWAPLLLLLVAALAPLPLLRTIDGATADSASSSSLGAQPFSEGRLAELRSARTPVFVYFTADWCLTCKVNEKAVLEQDEVAASFRERGIQVLVGDWTSGDEAIGRFLERHGRSGVPLYLYYSAGGEAEILPQILTVGRLTALGSETGR